MPPTFAQLKKGYPLEDRAGLFHMLGGGWPDLIPDTTHYGNTCALRLSVALKRAGVSIPSGYREMMQGDGTPLVVKVATMGKLVSSLYGEPWGMRKNEGTPLQPSDLPSYTGIVAYHVAWKDATGHFDLWTGTGFVGAGKFSDVAKGYDVVLWKVA